MKSELAELPRDMRSELAVARFPKLLDQRFPINLHEAWMDLASQGERVALEESVGRIALEFVTPYPPGAPRIIPGQLITREVVEFIIQLHRKGGEIILSDPENLTILVVRER